MSDLERFIEIGIALSVEKNHNILLKKILYTAKELANADAGTIYSIDDGKLVFETLFNDTLGLQIPGEEAPVTGDVQQLFQPINIFEFGDPNRNAVVAISAAEKRIINISDAYQNDEFNLDTAKAMDKKLGYKTQSILSFPMTNHQNEVNGVIQLINAKDNNNQVIAFDNTVERKLHALASLAAVIVTNQSLIDELENLFSVFSKLIAGAIDRKSPYTGGHCRRVPEITMLLAHACHDTVLGPLAPFTMSAEDFHELSFAAWLHDCGKVATPEYVMDKATKLETVFDRINIIHARFEVASRDIYNNDELSTSQKVNQLKQLEDDRQFLTKANKGGEFFTDDDIERVHQISKHYIVTIANVKQPVLSKDEAYNLITRRGTLNAEERRVINGHMDVTVEMLEAMPFPKHLQRVPEFACGHHEKMDGTGYPKGLKRDEMSIPARIMAIADIFEALTANDRPYKDPKTLSETLGIMNKMKETNHIDPDLYDVFINERVYLAFAEKFLDKTQIDME